MEQLVFIVGAVAWWSTALVHKDGPWDIFEKFRQTAFKIWGHTYVDGVIKQKAPFVCTFCTGPWVLIPIILVNAIVPDVIKLFGVLGFAAAVRGLSQEY